MTALRLPPHARSQGRQYRCRPPPGRYDTRPLVSSPPFGDATPPPRATRAPRAIARTVDPRDGESAGRDEDSARRARAVLDDATGIADRPGARHRDVLAPQAPAVGVARAAERDRGVAVGGEDLRDPVVVEAHRVLL